MKELNEKTAGKMLHPERVIQFEKAISSGHSWIGLSRK